MKSGVKGSNPVGPIYIYCGNKRWVAVALAASATESITLKLSSDIANTGSY